MIVEIVAGEVDFIADDIVVIDTTTPNGSYTLVVTTHHASHGVGRRDINIDIASATTTHHAAEFTRKVHHIHKGEAFGIGIVAHANYRHLPCAFKGVHIESPLHPVIGAGTGHYFTKASFFLIFFQ